MGRIIGFNNWLIKEIAIRDIYNQQDCFVVKNSLHNRIIGIIVSSVSDMLLFLKFIECYHGISELIAWWP